MSSFRLNVAPDELCQVNFLGELCKVFGQGELCQVNKINKNLDKVFVSCYALLFQVGELCQVISRGVMLSFLVFFRW